MAKNCWTSSSSSAGRLRQEPSTTKNCCTSSSIREEFLKSPIAPHRVLESAIFPLSHRVLSARGRCRPCGPRFPDNTSTNLRQHLFCEGKQHLEGQMASVATQIFEVGLKGADGSQTAMNTRAQNHPNSSGSAKRNRKRCVFMNVNNTPEDNF